MNKILRFVLTLVHTVIESVKIENESIIISVRPWSRYRFRCPICGKRCSYYDCVYGPRKWRTLDLGCRKCYLSYCPCRIRCHEHGVLVESVPWARHKSRFSKEFEDWVSCLTLYTSISAVATLARIEWHSVGGICKRVIDDLEVQRGKNKFDDLKRIGIDETSYKKGHKYLTVIVDHDRGCLVWAHKGYGKEVLKIFFEQLTRKQRRDIEVVTADGAKWIKSMVNRYLPNAKQVMDPFHVISWMTDALNDVRCSEWRQAKSAAKKVMPKKRSGPGRPKKGEEVSKEARQALQEVDAIKGSRFVLLKNYENLSDSQQKKLMQIKNKAGSHLFRAWELKEDLRAVYKAKTVDEAEVLLDVWLHQAAYCKIKPVVEVEKKIRRRKEDVIAAIRLGIGNGRVEAINNKIKLTVKIGYGFRNIDNLIALLMLRCSDLKPQLPHQPEKKKKEEMKDAA